MSAQNAAHDDGAPGAVFVGLISGTSADGIDAAVVHFTSDTDCELLHGTVVPWDAALRARLVAIGQGGDAASIDEIGTLDVQVGEAFAAAALQAIEASGVGRTGVTAIGSHGQTIRHRPAGARFDGAHPFTWQIGDAHVIAERTGIATVADFRRRDIAAGGQAAPLVPAFHAAVLRDAGEDRAVLNLGGIANVTLLPAHGAVRGFDTGPANCLLDAWCLRHRGTAFDADGAFAASGTVDAALLERLRAEAWFDAPPPKSSGREQFQLAWVEARLRGDEAPADVQATLLQLSAITVADALRATQPATRRVIACGGGVRNAPLMAAIAARLPGVVVESSAPHGLDPDFVEAMAFAWLARRTLRGEPGNLVDVTGARGPRVLGVVHFA